MNFTDALTAALFAEVCEARMHAATDPKDAEFWRRLLGSVKRAASLL